jgi:hypothetical protein
VIRHADEDGAAVRIGKGRHFCRQRFGIVDVGFELTGAVFTKGNLGKQVMFGKGHDGPHCVDSVLF